MADLHVVCACGWESSGPEEDVIAATQAHGRDLHNMEATREQVLEMSQPRTTDEA